MDNNYERLIITKDWVRDFRDICVCALRYALGRHTYVVEEVCSFIKDNPTLILDKRTVGVMLRDIELQLCVYENNIDEGEFKYSHQCDLDCIKDLKEFLISYGKSNFKETNKDNN